VRAATASAGSGVDGVGECEDSSAGDDMAPD
jgi:hypothetical protein